MSSLPYVTVVFTCICNSCLHNKTAKLNVMTLEVCISLDRCKPDRKCFVVWQFQKSIYECWTSDWFSFWRAMQVWHVLLKVADWTKLIIIWAWLLPCLDECFVAVYIIVILKEDRFFFVCFLNSKHLVSWHTYKRSIKVHPSVTVFMLII